MSDPAPAATAGSAPADRTVHWIGTGLSVGPTALRTLCEQPERLVLWGRRRERATETLRRFGLEGRAVAAGLDRDEPAAALRPGDVLVSMLPASEHPGLLRTAIDRGAHFACASYASDEVAALAPAAARAGTVVLTDTGLDPGLDHLMAHRLVADARRAVGDTAEDVRFTSYCGGLPAEVNEFRYRFSWAPYGVLAALGTPARFVADGAERRAPRPWEATRTLRRAGEAFEAYPNRDSLPFVGEYGFPEGWRLAEFVRGTLRNTGWRAAWAPVFEAVASGDPARLRDLAGELARRYPATAEDRDRVVLAVTLALRAPGGGGWRGEYLLDLTGGAEESAMALCVSLPLAHGVVRVLRGALPAGLHRAVAGTEADDWMAFFGRHGIHATYRQDDLP
ncbi:saccharopine dehydrogenase NADP-binding domain-containing protein [Streptomyces sp. LP05-1]|uniref:Saccharopine dehydrogenase NADP-binding domain-containing protein n=1 Tax=Streptomyces pyxinae TaxID=2970734 RepID=A0ABT2CBB8_9ACTN|nr:saccharopine dehydrogenase C-terminal domain-containing protein [Streptomyces sp. LP05-1]MCS0634706.1 saccharopine dehydrogenase NADP-binding domain-containing protein [Streptomyces sp. LP05-1]